MRKQLSGRTTQLRAQYSYGVCDISLLTSRSYTKKRQKMTDNRECGVVLFFDNEIDRNVTPYIHVTLVPALRKIKEEHPLSLSLVLLMLLVHLVCRYNVLHTVLENVCICVMYSRSVCREGEAPDVERTGFNQSQSTTTCGNSSKQPSGPLKARRKRDVPGESAEARSRQLFADFFSHYPLSGEQTRRSERASCSVVGRGGGAWSIEIIQ